MEAGGAVTLPHARASGRHNLVIPVYLLLIPGNNPWVPKCAQTRRLRPCTQGFPGASHYCSFSICLSQSLSLLSEFFWMKLENIEEYG